MYRMKLNRLVCMVAGTVFSSYAVSANADDAYLGGALGGAYFYDACSTNTTKCNNQQPLWGGYAGLYINYWLSGEIGIFSYGKPRASYSSGDVSANVWGADLSLLMSHSLSPQSTLYARAGAGLFDIHKSQGEGRFSSASKSQTILKPLLGLGFEHEMSPNWAGRLEYRFVDGIGSSAVGHADLHALMVGLVYRWGKERSQNTLQVPDLVDIGGSSVSDYSATVLFAPGSSWLTPTAMRVLDAIVSNMNTRNIDEVVVSGHTDSIASVQYNIELATKRARIVKEYLEAGGVPDKHITLRILGESRPIAENITALGREKNRRVELCLK
ncbi:OmpA family protein [Aeromonas sp. JL9]|uniref:OmpA family protein n=1 Tax=Aeromonas sp. JL9 TaxID=2950549 RepID=UPI00210A81F0|nr:OmpA family protein [Aeromonas sp. JL9]MCQ4111572.1 OmpA family protein [Aeromonas sp. JL9]